jgi:gliding motility-associated transport system ATP-binding protein
LFIRRNREENLMIEVSHLVKSYRDLKAVQDVTFKVEKGEILGFLGPNGAGKTTTMRMLTGVLPPTSGSVKVAGFDVFEQPMEVKKRIGYLPETPPVYTDMTVRAYLRFVAEIKGVRRAQRESEVEKVATQTNCRQFIHRVIGNLSKGQRQRVGLAQALLHDPEVLILDEPTVGLDPAQIIEVRELIKGLAGKHTIVLSTHILPEVVATCQRVLIIAQGKVVADDTLQGLQNTHAGSLTADGHPGPAPSLEEIFLKLTSA